MEAILGKQTHMRMLTHGSRRLGESENEKKTTESSVRKEEYRCGNFTLQGVWMQGNTTELHNLENVLMGNFKAERYEKELLLC